jgi:gamma-glutamyl hercynylcysteine S-oxide synthase
LRQGSREELRAGLIEVRSHLLGLFTSLRPDQWAVPQWSFLNPPAWEFGHVAWFQEYWCQRVEARQVRRPSCMPRADELFNSSLVGHATRWSLELPTQAELLDYLARTLEKTLSALDAAAHDDDFYFFRLVLFHEQMHVEAMLMNWVSLEYQLPPLWQTKLATALRPEPSAAKFIRVRAGQAQIGSPSDSGFVFDNEKWLESIFVPDFRISAGLVTNAQFQEFVSAQANPFVANMRWRAGSEQNLQAPAAHVSWHEAKAYCEWKGGSLPSEAQWCRAAQSALDFTFGQQLWEWTASSFEPLAGFSADPYEDYSQPWFGDHVVVKGGSWATHISLKDGVYRNFYQPHRADPFIGFRVCYNE